MVKFHDQKEPYLSLYFQRVICRNDGDRVAIGSRSRKLRDGVSTPHERQRGQT